LHINEKKYSVVFTMNASHALEKIATCFTIEGQFMVLDRCHTSVVGLAPMIATKQSRSVPDCLLVKNEAEVNEYVTNKTIKEEPGGLFAFPAQCNFSGQRYPLEWIPKMQKKHWKVLVDTASYASTTPFDLSIYSPEFLVFSFYKMFGYPTGLGALIVRNDMKEFLDKQIIGGGTVSAIAVNPFYAAMKDELSECLEDGTIPFQQILALDAGFDYIETRFGNWDNLFQHCNGLMEMLIGDLRRLQHHNERPLVQMFRETNNEYGPILSFHVLDSLGHIVGYSEVIRLAGLKHIHLRAGRFCNPGGAQHYLGLTSQEIVEMREAYGHVCGDGHDKLGSKATGALRVSLGFCNTQEDIQEFVSFLREYFVQEYVPVEIPADDSVQCDLIKLFIYPIKSCGGLEVSSWPIGSSGLLYDRQFMLCDKIGNVMNQKKYPQLKLIEIINLDLSTKILEIRAPGMDVLEIPLLGKGACFDTKICEWNRTGSQVNQSWFERFLGVECSLVRVPIKNNVSYANRAQFSLISSTSVIRLKERIDPVKASHIGIHSFRPNVVVNWPNPDEENHWVGKTIRLNEHLFIVTERSERCQMICVDEKGQKHSEPLLALAKQRVDVSYCNIGKDCVWRLFKINQCQ
jgi:molybdenum cofactor sulfurtransferase